MSDNYPLRAKVISTFYGHPTTHEYGGHTVTAEDLQKRLLECGYHLTMIRGWRYKNSIVVPGDDDLEQHVSYIYTKQAQDKTEFKKEEAAEYDRLRLAGYGPYVYFEEGGPWTKYPSSVYESCGFWLTMVPVTMVMEEGTPANEGQK